jgi:hypothetical protein
MNMMQCQICGHSEGNKVYTVKEMMFGFRDEFSYFECSECGCLQIGEAPKNLSKYYPRNYGGFRSVAQFPKTSGIRQYLRQKRLKLGFWSARAIFGKGGLIDKLLSSVLPIEYLRAYSLSQISLTAESRILDVGCGSGSFLYILRELGFRNLLGIDAFIEADITHNNGTKIRKGTIQDVSGKWDLVMFHHSFEHMPDQFKTLDKTAGLLSKKGSCLIRVPTVSSYAWKHYREKWVQLDAPRHLCIHSIKSMKLLADKSKLSLQNVTYDSDELQFWGSEQYLKDNPFRSESSYGENPTNSIFSKDQLKSFKQKAKELNRTNQGDQVAFLLSKIEDQV